MTPRATNTGSPLRRRAVKGLERAKALAAGYIAEGMSEEDAMSRAYEELRNNPRADWRANPDPKSNKNLSAKKKARLGKLGKAKPRTKTK